MSMPNHIGPERGNHDCQTPVHDNPPRDLYLGHEGRSPLSRETEGTRQWSNTPRLQPHQPACHSWRQKRKRPLRLRLKSAGGTVGVSRIEWVTDRTL